MVAFISDENLSLGEKGHLIVLVWDIDIYLSIEGVRTSRKGGKVMTA
jgi:hypothetical protein